MKRFRGKIIMAAIILSCGFVMQFEQASEAGKSDPSGPRLQRHDVAHIEPQSAGDGNVSSLSGSRSPW